MSVGLQIERVATGGMIGAGRPGLPPEGVWLDNNVWIVGDDREVIVVDAAHDADAIAHAVGDRDVLGLLLTHGHEDHVNAARAVAERLDTHTYLHPADLFLWQETHGDSLPDFELEDQASFRVAGSEIVTLHTPGHTPGSVCFLLPEQAHVLSGDTLFEGGPGATRWEYSSFPQIVQSIRERLFVLPGETRVSPGHGPDTRIDTEHPQLEAWLARGW